MVCEKFVVRNGDPGFVGQMVELAKTKEVGTIVEFNNYKADWLRVRHIGQSWTWPTRALKFHLEGDVPVAPVKAPVEAPKALAEDVKPKAKAKKVKKPAIIKNLRAEMNKRAAKGPGTASYAVQFKDGTVRWQIADACHARITSSRYKDGDNFGKIVKVATAVKPYYDRLKTPAEKKAYKRYVEYITKRSPFADCFEPCAAPTRYSVYMNLKRSAHNVAAAAISLREGSEQYGGKVSTFIWLIEQGFDEDTAWVVSRWFHPDGEDGGNYSYRGSSGHDTITGGTNEDKFFSVFTNGLFMNDKPYLTKQETYQVYKCFGSNDEYGVVKGSIGEKIKAIAEIKAAGGWMDKETCNAEGLKKAATYVAEKIAAAKAARK